MRMTPSALCIYVLLTFISASLYAGALQLDKTYRTFHGPAISLKQELGHKPIYLKLWASWCLDCRHQMPDLQAVYDQYHEQLAIYAVNLNINEDEQTLQRIIDKYQLRLPIVMDNNSSIAGNFNFAGTPFHVLINAQGQVVYTSYHADEQLHQKLDQLAHQASLAPSEKLLDEGQASAPLTLPKGLAFRYFTASWCSWYFADIEPEMAHNCVQADAFVKKVYSQLTSTKTPWDWQSYATYLWAEAKDVEDYRTKTQFPFALIYDQNNAQARAYKVTQYPSLLVFNNGREVGRLTHFENQPAALKQLQAWLPK